jgi:20S proteasome alpha/beta subunit
MTIVAGFRCSDGIVLAADREVTYSDLLKVQRGTFCSVESFTADGGHSVVFAGAGERDYLGYFFEKVSDYIHSGMTSDAIQKCLQEAMHEVYKTHIYPFHSVQPEAILQMLIGVVVRGEQPTLLRAHKSLVTKAANFDSIGYGSTLAHYLADRMVSQRTLSLREAKPIAAGIVQKVGRYVPYCSDEVEMVVIDGDAKLKKFDPFLSELAEAPLYLIERSMEEFLSRIGEWETDKEEFDSRFAELEKQIRERLGFT